MKNNKIKKLKGKAENLDFLTFFSSKNVIIPDYFYFSIIFFKKNKKKIIQKIIQKLKKNPIIIRSSSVFEDQKNISNAGKYDSLSIDNLLDHNIILSKIENFLKQFHSPKDKIIVQTLITKVDYAGVIFTKDANYNSPYYVINYDDSGKTNLITSGTKSKNHKNLVIYKNFKGKLGKFQKLITICKKIEKKAFLDRLDIEFAIKNKKIYLFQVRPLPLKNNKFSQLKYTDKDFGNFLINIKKKIKKLSNNNSLLPGKTSIFSNMADWNPAEMISDKPNLLSLSIYKELITDDVWRRQRSIYGYKDVSPNPLLFSFAGSPYIDLRTDLNSFLPNQLNEKDSTIIVNKYLSELYKNPSIHDKIEFELIETCYSFLTKKRLDGLFPKNLSGKYLKYLKKLTQNILNNNYLDLEIKKIFFLEKEIKKIKRKNISDLQKIFFMIKSVKKYGTLPFAGLARCSFIAQRILNDLKESFLLSSKEYENFYSSAKTITTIFNNDFLKLKKKKITKKKFLEKYGHLRPSTYDINSLNYDEGFNLYFKNFLITKHATSKKINFKNSKFIDLIFKKDLKISFNNFINFANKAIYFREYSKFIFTKGINNIFETLINFGNELKINRRDLSYLDIKRLLNFYSNLEVVKLKNNLKEDIKKNKFESDIMNLIRLPDIITSENNVYKFYENLSKPNYVTLKKVIGEVVDINIKNLKLLNNKIVKIKNADPGFDYIFNYNIKGLITQYGGANSHMAIRCLELNIPGVIGVGKLNYEKIKPNNRIMIDCSKKEFRLLNE